MEQIFNQFSEKNVYYRLQFSLQFLGHTECLVAGEHSHDGNRRRDRSDRRPDASGSSVIISPAYSQDAEAHENPWLLTIARWWVYYKYIFRNS